MKRHRQEEPDRIVHHPAANAFVDVASYLSTLRSLLRQGDLETLREITENRPVHDGDAYGAGAIGEGLVGYLIGIQMDKSDRNLDKVDADPLAQSLIQELGWYEFCDLMNDDANMEATIQKLAGEGVILLPENFDFWLWRNSFVDESI